MLLALGRSWDPRPGDMTGGGEMALLQPVRREPRSSADREAERVYFLKTNTAYRTERVEPGARRKTSAPVISGTRLGGGARIRGGVL